ncbi:MAG: hypothetical protein WC693_02355 [Patescibacteria group bacterium]|jgi:hypothetical protein
MLTLLRRVFVFLALVSVMAIYPHTKWGNSYLTAWWVMARAAMIPFLFVAIHIATMYNPHRLLKVVLGIGYYGSALVACQGLPYPQYPSLDIPTLMILCLIPLILYWQDPDTLTQSEILDSEHSPRVRTP